MIAAEFTTRVAALPTLLMFSAAILACSPTGSAPAGDGRAYLLSDDLGRRTYRVAGTKLREFDREGALRLTHEFDLKAWTTGFVVLGKTSEPRCSSRATSKTLRSLARRAELRGRESEARGE